MGAYTTLAVNQDSYNRIIETIKDGYTGKDGIKHRPAPHMACCLVIQANLGCRIGDILHLSLSSLVSDGDHYRLDIVEQKTGKARRHQVPEAVYSYIRAYCAENGINPERRIFQLIPIAFSTFTTALPCESIPAFHVCPPSVDTANASAVIFQMVELVARSGLLCI